MQRNWKGYNEKLVRRGEIYISLDFLENWDEDLSRMNKGKVGRPFLYPKSFMQFLASLYIAFSTIQTDRRLSEETIRVYTQVKSS